MKIRTAAACLATILLLASPARAELLRVEIKTLGMDWETCAHAVRVAMRKVEGVQNVQVSLKDGLTILDLRPNNKVTLAALRTIIKNNGFVSENADVVARGTSHADVFEVSGTGERIRLSAPPVAAEAGKWRLTATVR